MPNDLFGSVGFALSADRRRPKTLVRRLTKEVRKRKLPICVVVPLSQLEHSSGKLTEPQRSG